MKKLPWKIIPNMKCLQVFTFCGVSSYILLINLCTAVILSHGNEGILYGYDSAYPAHKIWEPFTADRCSSLIGKPKLFFIQACQGSKMDHGVPVKANMGRTSTDSFASYRTPLHADFLLAHSTVAGYYSWRNTVQGSWFIQVESRKIILEFDF